MKKGQGSYLSVLLVALGVLYLYGALIIYIEPLRHALHWVNWYIYLPLLGLEWLAAIVYLLKYVVE